MKDASLGSLASWLPPAIAAQVEQWMLLTVAPEVAASSGSLLDQPGLPAWDLAQAVQQILLAQPAWVVWCFRDYDQRPVQSRGMSPAEVAAQLRENVLGRLDHDFVAWSLDAEGGLAKP